MRSLYFQYAFKILDGLNQSFVQLHFGIARADLVRSGRDRREWAAHRGRRCDAAGVEAMVGVGVVAAAAATGALGPVEGPQPAMTRPAARASTDPRMTPSSGARDQALPRARAPVTRLGLRPAGPAGCSRGRRGAGVISRSDAVLGEPGPGRGQAVLLTDPR